MAQRLSTVHSRVSGRNLKPFEMAAVTDSAVNALARIGIVFDHATVSDQLASLQKAGAFRTGAAMDSAFVSPVTSPSIPTPIQFLQTWLPGFVKVLTAARKIDEIIGIQTVGSWEDEEIVQGIVEPSGIATEYGDLTNIPLASWNTNFARRTIVRGEMGMSVGLLEEGRASAMRLNSAETKRQAAAVSLEMFRNAVGFFGWNNGAGRTFGLLNDPNLLPVITLPNGSWTLSGDWKLIIADIRAMISKLRTQSQDNIDPLKAKLCLVLPTDLVDCLSITTEYGISISDWLTQTYKNLRVVSAPEFMGVTGATGFEKGMAYLFVEDVDSSVDGSTDDGAVFAQLVQTKFITLGVEKRAKSYVEDYSSASAGTLCKRPWGVVRALLQK